VRQANAPITGADSAERTTNLREGTVFFLLRVSLAPTVERQLGRRRGKLRVLRSPIRRMMSSRSACLANRRNRCGRRVGKRRQSCLHAAVEAVRRRL
jgi:hypothetical protein